MKYIIILFLMTGSVRMVACDICGCSIGGYHFGILPNYRYHYVGLRYQYAQFHSIHEGENSTGDDYFHNVELWGRTVLWKKVQLYGVIPYHFNRRVEDNTENKVSGLSDISVLAHYTLLDQSNSEGDWKHFIQPGLGLKLPTGKYDVKVNKNTLAPAIQPGTGSLDEIASLIYIIKYKKFGWSNDFNYRLNGTNGNDYRFGNKTTVNSQFFWVSGINQAMIIPHVGATIEWSDADSERNKPVEFTGGSALGLLAGVDVYLGDISVGINTQLPLTQDLNQGQTTAKPRWQLAANYYF
ncbi:MAG TPA: hypothetical protein PK076_12770 [Saprospiraceae bacterium]|nr:hypothetical protein [Saprospiraceae bacterium]HQW56999.1 hypothetical protein [Saprospiraceae bacterium]